MPGLILTETLLKIQPRITKALIPQAQLLLAQFHASTQAFRHAEPLFIQLACELEGNAVKLGLERGVREETRLQFLDDRREMTCLQWWRRRRGLRAARGGE